MQTQRREEPEGSTQRPSAETQGKMGLGTRRYDSGLENASSVRVSADNLDDEVISHSCLSVLAKGFGFAHERY